MSIVIAARILRDGEEWKDSSSFSANELLTLAKALSEAHTWIFQQRAATSSRTSPSDSGSQSVLIFITVSPKAP